MPQGAFWIDPVSVFGLTICSADGYEPLWTKLIPKLIRPGHCFVHVGANEGYFSVLAAKAGAQVIAIEPQTRLVPVIKRNLELNGVSAKILNIAISDKAGDAELFLSSSINNGATSFSNSTRFRPPRQTVRTQQLQTLVPPAVDLIKIDMEGYEWEAIFGSTRLFQERSIKAIMLDIHPNQLNARGLDPSEITRFLTKCGYKQDQTYWHWHL